MASLRSLRETVTVRWPQQQQEQAKAHLLKTARTGNAQNIREQTNRSGGIAPDVTAYANRPGNSDLDSVVLPGPIVFKYGYLREVITAALDLLRSGSPVHTGAYRNSHTVYLNGKATKSLPERIGETDEIIIANPLPYARKIEVGTTESGRKFVLQVDNHLYERTAQTLKAKYRNVAKIEYTLVQLPDAYTLKTGTIGRRHPRAGSKHRGAALTYPALVITSLK